MENKLYTIKEVAKIFSVSEQTVRNWQKDGFIKFIRLGNGGPKCGIRISQKEIDRFIEASTEYGGK